MTRIVFVFGLICLSAACEQDPARNTATHTKAQQPVGHAPQTAPPPAPIKARPVSLDDAATRLPEAFVSDDIERVISSLKPIGKSEFETTEAYRRRIAVEATAKVYSFITEPLETTYDADHEQMRVRLRLKVDPSTDYEENSLTVPVRNKVERTTFPASNAFGVQVQVRRTTETAHGLAAVPVLAQMIGKRVPGAMYQLEDGRQHYQRFLEVRVPLPPDDARQRKESLRFLLRARLSTQTKVRTYERSYEWKATIDSPTSTVTETYAAYVDLARFAVWVVDVARGDILVKTSLPDLLKIKGAS